MKAKILTIVLLLSAMTAKAVNEIQICREHTQSEKSYNICVNNANNESVHTAICADIALQSDNTYKTIPFKKCLKVSESRKLSYNSVKRCGDTSGTHVGFAQCLDTVETEL